MALLSEEMDSDLLRLWGLVAELSEQLNQNRAMTAALQAQANQAKGQVIHSGTGFVLRRFNTDLSKEVFESELEKMNASLVIENQTLLHENKQLSSLLKEYETTLETVMTKFRSQSHTSQQHELALTRHYESLILSRENSTLTQELISSSTNAESLSRLSHFLRLALRSLAGEDDPEAAEAATTAAAFSRKDSQSSGGEEREGYREGGYAGSPPPLEDWALEREIEISRLEKENEELRRLLNIREEVANTDLSEQTPPTWDGASLSASLSRLSGSGPLRRGLLYNNRAKMMGAGRGGPGMSPGVQVQHIVGTGGGTPNQFAPSAQWATDSTQKKVGSYFKEFPT